MGVDHKYSECENMLVGEDSESSEQGMIIGFHTNAQWHNVWWWWWGSAEPGWRDFPHPIPLNRWPFHIRHTNLFNSTTEKHKTEEIFPIRFTSADGLPLLDTQISSVSLQRNAKLKQPHPVCHLCNQEIRVSVVMQSMAYLVRSMFELLQL